MAHTQEEIKMDVINQLYWDSAVDASDIVVEVSDGNVTLDGSVPGYISLQMAETDAWSIEGVTAVNNRLRIRYPAATVMPADRDTQERIRNIYSWHPNVDESSLYPEVRNGNVTINGSVDTLWKKQLAEGLVFEIAGISSVHNKIQVVPTENYTDEEISDSIWLALDRNSYVDSSSMQISVQNGVVTVSGKVKNWGALNAVQMVVSRTPGVTGLVNHLTVG